MFASILSGFGGAGLGQILKVGGGVLTVLLIVPALLRLFIVTVDEGWAAIRTRNGRPIIRKREHAVRYTRGPKAGQLKHAASPEGELVVLRPGTHGAFPLLLWYRMVDVRTRAADLPARHLTTGTGHTYLVQASIEWRPEVTGRALRVFELEVLNVHERVSNVVGAALRDVIRDLGAPPLPSNADMSDLVLAECRQQVLEACGVELLRVTLTGDALTEGYMLAEAIRTRDPGDVVVPLAR
ncbi:SPFH domain-containing protein [Agrococcus jejuensis]|uniref:SPFH domain-containing protein n=1 Tax=Agrococcus jejuensis TaxID=399736 RepID=UPI0011A14055|nr:SPFH domain-containing protein [Agrococcus jejuensis]